MAIVVSLIKSDSKSDAVMSRILVQMSRSKSCVTRFQTFQGFQSYELTSPTLLSVLHVLDESTELYHFFAHLPIMFHWKTPYSRSVPKLPFHELIV